MSAMSTKLDPAGVELRTIHEIADLRNARVLLLLPDPTHMTCSVGNRSLDFWRSSLFSTGQVQKRASGLQA
jgi:hypothetical protein